MASEDVITSSNTEGRKRRYLLFNSNDVSELWKNLSVSTNHVESRNEIKVASYLDEADEPLKTADPILGEELHCRTCLVSFTEEEDYRAHYKDDWHRYNLKQKLNGRPPLSQEKFVEMEDGISSISGSDSEDEDDLQALKSSVGSPKVCFQNENGKQMAIYRVLLLPKKVKLPESDELLQLITQLPKQNRWAIVMLGGGHFAAAIYKGSDLTHHKTFHSYTVRAKQGGSQSSRDNKSGGGSHPKSAGASLRRYNEAAFAEHVQETFTAWTDVLKQCHLIFYRATSSNQTVIFGGKNPVFERNDPRLRSIPFPTRRATLKEAQRVWLQLVTIEILDEKSAVPTDEMQALAVNDEQNLSSEVSSSDEELKILEEQRAKRNQKKLIAKIKSNIAEQPFQIDPNDEGLFPGEKDIMERIVVAVRHGNPIKFDEEIKVLVELLSAYKEEYPFDLMDVLNQRLGEECSTLLHTAASAPKRAAIVWKLLELGCNPSLNDALGRVPYQLATAKETRETFRRFMGAFPDRFDYSKSCIPSPLTEDIEKQKLEKLAEKRKQQKKQQKAKKAAERVKLEEEKALQEVARKAQEEARLIEEEKHRFLALSDREKRALAAERRLLANVSSTGAAAPVLVRCFMCGEDMSGKIPFEYNSYKFCSPPCLQKHRKSGAK